MAQIKSYQIFIEDKSFNDIQQTYDHYEELPEYSCSINKEGKVKILKEKRSDGTEPFFSQWKTYYFTLTGTLLNVYKDKKYKKLYKQINMANIKVFKLECCKQDCCFFFRTKNLKDNYTALIRAKSKNDTLDWLCNFMSAINISSDLDYRTMPGDTLASNLRQIQRIM